MHAGPKTKLADWASGKVSDVDLFEDQLEGWLFAPAKYLAQATGDVGQHAGPAILTLVTPYFEMVSCYREGRKPRSGESTTFLKNGLKQVFAGLSQEVVDKYANEVRNGFAHEAMFRRVLVHRGGLPDLGLHAGVLAVNPWWLLNEAEIHFRRYVSEVRSNRDTAILKPFNEFMTARKQ